ncbi:GNAT family N-acetyltransferase [Hoeflea sp. YIM 152468]|uniref:GNAT family N-acetyltransferase n=1 Tax=Hoeflea sp. YIM 152468 TaxID=3031759 RepID=UPI0023DC9C28|nr:GNAT family N-acetyltransferase [Hoeflea sp. YIM 152468]MDF1609624.1 GNAT family N-acetyltransferase [Hoeflea sp. YIM 152468]
MTASADLHYSVLSPAGIAAALADLAQLRIAVFAAWPYLYDGDADYEAGYLSRFAASPGAVVVAARDDAGRMVGAATAAPLTDHAEEFAAPFAGAGLDPDQFFYLAESVLLPEFRGRGAGRAFFQLREAAGRAQGFGRAAFASVIRPADHPARPDAYLPLDPFWRRLGYQPLVGVRAEFSWRDIGEAQESSKPLQVWCRDL